MLEMVDRKTAIKAACHEPTSYGEPLMADGGRSKDQETHFALCAFTLSLHVF
jgi:hypothetical protein